MCTIYIKLVVILILVDIIFHQHSPTNSSGDVTMTVPDRLTTTGAPRQPIGKEQPNSQETKPKKRKKKAKALDTEEKEGVQKTGVDKDKLEFPGIGSNVNEHVTGRGMVDGSATLVEKKKRKKKPKEKAEVKEPKEPKSPKRPKTSKEPREPKEKKAKSSIPKARTPKKTR